MLPDREVIDIGAAENDGTGDTLREAGSKTNNNFQALFDGYDDNANNLAEAQAAANRADQAAQQAMATNKAYRLIPNGGTANALSVVTAPVTVPSTGHLTILQPSAVNTDAMTVAIDGAAPIPLYRSNGQQIAAGQIQPGHYLARVAGSGQSLQLILLNPIEAPPLAQGASTDANNFISPRRLIPYVARARRVVDGRVVAIANNGNGTITISTTQGRVWDEDTAGSPSFRIAAAENVVLAVNRALVVNLDSAPDGQGRLVPEVINLGSTASIGWQTGNRIVLFSHTTTGATANPVDQIYGGGAYAIDLPIPGFADAAAVAAGSSTTIVSPSRLLAALQSLPIAPVTFDAAANTDPNVLVGTTPLARSLTSGQIAQFIVPATNTGPVTLALDGEAARVLANRDGSNMVAGQLVAGSTVTVFRSLSGSSYRLMAAVPASAADMTAGTDTAKMVTPAAARTALLAEIRRARYHVTGRIYTLTPGAGKVTVTASQGRVWGEKAGGAPLYKIEAVSAVDIPNGQALMVDLDGALNGNGRLVPFVGNPASAANSGWQTGNKLVLFSNWNSDLGSAPDQIFGGGFYALHQNIPDTTALQTNVLRARRSVDGLVYKLVNNKNGTVTVALSQGRVWKEANGGQIEYRIAAVADTTLATNQAIIADLDSAPDANGRIVPVVQNLAAAAAAGWQSGNKLVLFSHTTSSSGSVVDQIYGGGAYKFDMPRIERDPDLLITRVTPSSGVGAMSINVPAAKTRWTSWRFVNSVSPANAKNCDVWRCAGQFDVALDASNAATDSIELTRPTEIETAVMQPGHADYSGGISHGNHLKSEFRALVDGKEFDPTVAAVITGRVFEFFQTSALYENGNPSNKIMDVYTSWRWTSKGLRLEVTYVVVGDVTFNYIYAGIFPVYRANAAGQAMVTKGRRSPPRLGNYEEDLSTNGYAQFNTKANELYGYGNGYGFRATKLRGYDDAGSPNRSTYFSPGVDNKFYFNHVTANAPQLYANGSVIGPVVTEFEIFNPN